VRKRFLVGTVIAAAAVALTGVSGVATAAPVAPAAHATGLAPAAPVAGLQPLQEFKTPGGGWFYTLNPGEAGQAVSVHKFAKSAVIGKLSASPIPGGVAIHRLRARSGNPSYMLSTSPAEIGSSQFVDEGVLGYADGTQRPGELKLIRFANNGKWRVLADGTANVNNMKAAGYNVDGPLGWFHP
jgi:hypothetical protein